MKRIIVFLSALLLANSVIAADNVSKTQQASGKEILESLKKLRDAELQPKKLPIDVSMKVWSMSGEKLETMIFEGRIQEPELFKSCGIVSYLIFNENALNWKSDSKDTYLLCPGEPMRKVKGYLYDERTPSIITINETTKKDVHFVIEEVENSIK